MRSYIKIYGPPILKAIKALEKIAIDMPEVCIMDTLIEVDIPFSEDYVMEYFNEFGEIPVERCEKIISKSGVKVGEYDFYFEWFENPSQKEFNDLVARIDNALTPIGSRYTITSKPR